MKDWPITLVVLAGIALLIVMARRRGWITRFRRGSFTGMVVYHDWANRDVQRGAEVIVERNAGAREVEEDTGEPNTPESRPDHQQERQGPT